MTKTEPATKPLPPVEQVRPGLWSIPVPLPIPLRYVFVYAFETEKGPFLVDAGWNGPVVVLNHSSLVDRRMWGAQVDALASHHRVITFEAGPEPVALGGVTRVEVGETFAYGLRGRRLGAPATVAVG